MLIGLKKEKLLWMAGEITLARRRIREAVFLMQNDEDRDFFSQCYHFEKEQFKQEVAEYVISHIKATVIFIIILTITL